ncbi:MAG: hypothetical protein NTV93_17675 [Verrucomicrobia bacterium]|nr:hypothetical protein [Verrucomicrobiota bacterium]
MKAAVFNDNVPWIKEGRIFDKVFAAGRRARLAEITDLYPEQITSANFEEHAGNLADLEVIFSTWDMPRLTEEQVRRMPAQNRHPCAIIAMAPVIVQHVGGFRVRAFAAVAPVSRPGQEDLPEGELRDGISEFGGGKKISSKPSTGRCFRGYFPARSPP